MAAIGKRRTMIIFVSRPFADLKIAAIERRRIMGT
jgi:hypothetical protein